MSVAVKKLYIVKTEHGIRDAFSFLTTLESTTVNLEIILKIMVESLSDLDRHGHYRDVFYQNMLSVVSLVDSLRFANYMLGFYDWLSDVLLSSGVWNTPSNDFKVALTYHGLQGYDLVIEVSLWPKTF